MDGALDMARLASGTDSPASSESLLTVSGLKLWFHTRRGIRRAVDGVDLEIRRGETLGLVGESGSGKSMLASAITGLYPPPGQIVAGSIRFDDVELANADESLLRSYRGRRIGLILQDPMSALNPVVRVGKQVTEALSIHRMGKRAEMSQHELGPK